MLKRILEPEVMDSAEDARDYDAMDHTAVNRVFIKDFLAIWNGAAPILDIGTGTAQIPIEFCRQSTSGTIVAIDLADHMLAVARRNVARLGLSDRIQLEKVNARQMPYPDGSFPAVMSNSIVHHMPEPRRLFDELIRVAAPGAMLFVRDLLRPPDLLKLSALVRTYAGDANEHQRKMFADSLHAALTVEEVRALVAERGFDPANVHATSDRHWTWLARTSSPLESGPIMTKRHPTVDSELHIALPDWVDALLAEPCRYVTDEDKMRLAIRLAQENVERKAGGPFGAAVFERDSDRLVGVGVNSVERLRNSVLHAEVLALMLAQARARSFTLRAGHLPEVELFTSSEPCAMCLGAILWSGVRRVVCGAGRDDVSKIGFDEGPVFPESYDYLHQRGIPFRLGVLKDEACAVLDRYHQTNGLVYNG